MTTTTLPPGGPPTADRPVSKEEQPIVVYGKQRYTGL